MEVATIDDLYILINNIVLDSWAYCENITLDGVKEDMETFKKMSPLEMAKKSKDKDPLSKGIYAAHILPINNHLYNDLIKKSLTNVLSGELDLECDFYDYNHQLKEDWKIA